MASRRGTDRGASWMGKSAVVGLLGVCALGVAGAAPEPDPVPRRWQLEVTPGPLRMVSMEVPGHGPRMYLYLTYNVVNNSGEDILFAPAFELANGEGEILRSGRDVPQAVTERIVASTQNPFAEDQIAIIGTLLQGREHGKDGVVIWPVTDANPERITIYAAGFSGETATVESPRNSTRFVLRKTLRLDYDTPGDLVRQPLDPIPVREKTWIMR